MSTKDTFEQGTVLETAVAICYLVCCCQPDLGCGANIAEFSQYSSLSLAEYTIRITWGIC